MNINKIRGKTYHSFFSDETLKKGDVIPYYDGILYCGQLYITSVSPTPKGCWIEVNKREQYYARQVTIQSDGTHKLIGGYLLRDEQYNEYKQLLRDDKINEILK